MRKRKIRPLATPEPLIRSRPTVAHVIRSWISIHMQNLVVIPSGVSFPHMCEITRQKCLLGFFFHPSNAPQPRPQNRFLHVIRQTMCLFGVRKQKSIFTPRNCRKTAILGPILTGLKKIFDRKPLYNGGAPM